MFAFYFCSLSLSLCVLLSLPLNTFLSVTLLLLSEAATAVVQLVAVIEGIVSVCTRNGGVNGVPVSLACVYMDRLSVCTFLMFTLL